MSRLSVIAMAMAAMISAAPASAQGLQQVSTGQVSEYLIGPSAGSLDLRSALGVPARAAPAQFAFRPDPGVRQSVASAALSRIARNDRALASALGNDPFGTFGPPLAAHNIRDSQLDDTLAFMMLTLWDAANASSAETTPGQTESVKRQARSLLAHSLRGTRPAIGSVQEASDSLFLYALAVSILAAKVMESGDPSTIRSLQDMARRETSASFGIDFSQLALTEGGLVPR